MATCRRWPSPVSRRLNSAPRIVIAISMPVPVSPIEMPGRVGGPFLSPVTLKVPPHAWAIMVEGEVVLERAAFAEALHLGVDDARIDHLHDVIGQAQPLDGAWGKVLDHHVRLANHVLDELEPPGGLEIDRDRLLVGVEGVKIVGIGVGLPGAKTTAGVSHLRVLDLHDIGTQPAECLGTGRTCLELGEIDDLHPLQEGEVADAGGHRTSFLTISRSVRARHSAATPSLSNVTRPRASSGSLTW